MAESKIRNAFSRSTIFTVGRLLAFIGVGFAIGLVIGVVSEEPELLAGHLRGDTETIELDAALAARPDEDALAAAAAARGERRGGALGRRDRRPLRGRVGGRAPGRGGRAVHGGIGGERRLGDPGRGLR